MQPIKTLKRTLPILIVLVATTSPSVAAGLLKPRDPEYPALQIRDHDVRVVINNGFAVTEVDQTFHNPHDQDLEAVYTFPLPKDASLSELSLWIDGAEIVGEVIEKKRAREIYQEERETGRDAALAEKREYYAFDVFVNPVRAQSDTRVRLVYLQPLEIDGGIGRYVYPLEEGRIDEEVHAFWDVLPQIHGSFAFECTLRSVYPIEDVRAKGYDALAQVRQESNDTWNVQISGEEGTASLDQDIVIYYRLAGDVPARVDLLTHRDGDHHGTFLLVITPGIDLQPITEGVDWSIVLDTSGSMAGKIAAATDAVSQAMDRMRPDDRVRIVAFSERPQDVLGSWTPVTPGALEEARQKLLALQAQGSTNVYAGFKAGLSRLEEGRTSAVILVSDGGANVGPTHYDAFRKLLDKKDIRVFTFVMGQGSNRPLLGRLAEESGGFSMDVSTRDDLYGRILQARDKLAREALHGVQVEIDGVATGELAPERLPSAYYGQQITMFGRYSGFGEATLRLRARISGEKKVWRTRVRFPESDTTYPELERLWALARVKEFSKRIEDEGKESELREAIVSLGTSYSIVTDYTSMIVVSEERFADLGIDRVNRERSREERDARIVRTQQAPRPTRADGGQPMFGAQPAHRTGGGGALGPGFASLIASLLGVRAYLRRRSSKV